MVRFIQVLEGADAEHVTIRTVPLDVLLKDVLLSLFSGNGHPTTAYHYGSPANRRKRVDWKVETGKTLEEWAKSSRLSLVALQSRLRRLTDLSPQEAIKLATAKPQAA